MEVRPLGKSDLWVSSIGMGCVTFGREIDEAASFQLMDRALERGITLFDTAEAYAEGRSEEVVGSWLASRRVRDQIVLATKVTPPLSRQRMVQAVEDSLRRLQTDVIDLYQLHAFDVNTPLEESLDALDAMVKQGKVRHIGCSNFAAWQLCKALWKAEVKGWAPLVSVQPNYNVAIRAIESELLPLCADQQIGVITYSPLGAGFLTGKYNQSWVAPQGSRFDIRPSHWKVYENESAMRRMEGLRTLAQESGISMVQLALAWVIGQPGVTSVLIGGRTPGQVDQAFAAEEAGLSPEMRQAISALS